MSWEKITCEIKDKGCLKLKGKKSGVEKKSIFYCILPIIDTPIASIGKKWPKILMKGHRLKCEANTSISIQDYQKGASLLKRTFVCRLALRSLARRVTPSWPLTVECTDKVSKYEKEFSIRSQGPSSVVSLLVKMI